MILKYPMILLVHNEGLDQTAQADLGLRCPHIPEDVFAWCCPHEGNDNDIFGILHHFQHYFGYIKMMEG